MIYSFTNKENVAGVRLTLVPDFNHGQKVWFTNEMWSLNTLRYVNMKKTTSQTVLSHWEKHDALFLFPSQHQTCSCIWALVKGADRATWGWTHIPSFHLTEKRTWSLVWNLTWKRGKRSYEPVDTKNKETPNKSYEKISQNKMEKIT